MSISFRTTPRKFTKRRGPGKPIPKNTAQYILDTLTFAPVRCRDLRRHMGRRRDFGYIMLDLIAKGLVTFTGSGKKNDPLIYRLVNL